MNITRREHATMVLEHRSERLVIDPGKFTTFPEIPTDVAAIVITHEHADHWAPELVQAISDANPSAARFATEAVASATPELGFTVAMPGGGAAAGAFDLRFFGGNHAEIHSSIPIIDNVGVLVNDSFFYGGDSLEPPGVAVETLAVPISGPWMKLGEMMDYVLTVAPRRAFGVHDLLNSPFGNDMAKSRLAWSVEQTNGAHIDLGVGETTEIG